MRLRAGGLGFGNRLVTRGLGFGYGWSQGVSNVVVRCIKLAKNNTQ